MNFRLYNKEAIIEAKLSKMLSKNPITAHIRSLSDVKELKLTDNKAFKDNGPDKVCFICVVLIYRVVIGRCMERCQRYSFHLSSYKSEYEWNT